MHKPKLFKTYKKWKVNFLSQSTIFLIPCTVFSMNDNFTKQQTNKKKLQNGFSVNNTNNYLSC